MQTIEKFLMMHCFAGNAPRSSFIRDERGRVEYHINGAIFYRKLCDYNGTYPRPSQDQMTSRSRYLHANSYSLKHDKSSIIYL